MQCKNIPTQPILDFLRGSDRWGTWFEGYENSVQNAMPEGTPPKLALAKMRQLIKHGTVKGCACGCRGDFELTA